MSDNTAQNPLATAPIEKLIPKFVLPAIVGMLTGALYNIVDQIFIGQGVGMLGNAATNVAFPITTVCTGLALLFGVGGSSNASLAMGRGEKDRAKRIFGSAFGCIIICGIILVAIVQLFLQPLMVAFGATDQILDLVMTYSRITSIGIPFLMFSTGGGHLVRADRSPTYAMIAVVSGAVLNTILDPIFIFVFGWGIAGAASATVISQIVSASLIIFYIPRFKTVKLTPKDFIPKFSYVTAIASLGMAACVNQLAMTAVQIVANNVMRQYGATSAYGSEIPLAVMGVVSKVNVVFLSIVIGIAQGVQPILGYNYGAKNYARVRKTFRLAATAATVVSVLAFLCFQFFPDSIISIFGSGDELYYDFARQYLRIFMFFTCINGLQPVTANFFTSIGKAYKGLLMSLTRQTIFLLPLIIILPMFLGIDGAMYAGPVSDGAAFVLAVVFLVREFRRIPKDNMPEGMPLEA